MRTYPTSRQHGFTLTELLVAIMIVGILMAIAAPSFQTWLKNSQIRNAAESITNGLQRARAEAVSRNTDVAFALGAGLDSSWSVSVAGSGIDSRTNLEGSKDVALTVTPAGTTTVTFNNFGGVKPNNQDGSAPFTSVLVKTTGGTRNLQVEIGVGGNAKMCDPSAPAGSTTAC